MPPERKPVKLHAEARAEIQQSVRFYRERAGDLVTPAVRSSVPVGNRLG